MVSTALRTGNKTVTLVDNVDVYGVEAKDLAERMQHVMASSASVSTTQYRCAPGSFSGGICT